MFTIHTPITRPVLKATGGKIHAEGCASSRRSRPMKETVGQTYAELIDKYGDALCQKCFGKAAAQLAAGK